MDAYEALAGLIAREVPPPKPTDLSAADRLLAFARDPFHSQVSLPHCDELCAGEEPG